MTSVGTSQPSVHLASTVISSSPSNFWIIDTGASNHICSSLSLLIEYSSCTSLSFVQLPNDSRASVTLYLLNNLHVHLFLLFNYLMIVELVLPTQALYLFQTVFYMDNDFYIPSFKYNLLSVTQLTKSLNCLIIFSYSHCMFQDSARKKTIGLSKVYDGLYFLQHSHALLAASTLSFDIWYWRLGHLAQSTLVKTIKRLSIYFCFK